jgi:hypothetical protein
MRSLKTLLIFVVWAFVGQAVTAAAGTQLPFVSPSSMTVQRARKNSSSTYPWIVSRKFVQELRTRRRRIPGQDGFKPRRSETDTIMRELYFRAHQLRV